MAELIAHMESTSLDNDSIARKLVELANALSSVKAVSYTHLDVYKRQVLSWAVPLITTAASLTCVSMVVHYQQISLQNTEPTSKTCRQALHC